MTLRADLYELLEGVPDERLEDVRAYLEHLREADSAWKAWEQQHGGSETDERIRRAVAEAEADPRPSVPHESVARWLRSWGTENELSSPNEN
jgi:predicted transcriptional regulator